MSFTPTIFQRRGTSIPQVDTHLAAAKRRADPAVQVALPPELAGLTRSGPSTREEPIFSSATPTSDSGMACSPGNVLRPKAEDKLTERHPRPFRPARSTEGRTFTCPQADWPLLLALAARNGQNRADLRRTTGKTRSDVNDFITRLRKSGALVPGRGLPRLDPNNASLRRELLRIQSLLHPAPVVPAPRIPHAPTQPLRALPVMDGYLTSRGILLKDHGQSDRALEFLAMQGRPGRLVHDIRPPNEVATLMDMLDHLPDRPHLVFCMPSHPAYLEVWRDESGVWRTQPLLAAEGRLPPAILLAVLTNFFGLPALQDHRIAIIALKD